MSSLLTCGLVLVLVACGSGQQGEVTIEGDPVEALAEAANAELGTVHYAFESVLDQGAAVLRVSGEGLVEPDGDSYQKMSAEYDFGPGEEAMRQQLEAAHGRDALDALDAMNGTVEWISTGGVVYTKSTPPAKPPPGGRPLPEGVEWVSSGDGPYGSSSLDMSGIREPLAIVETLRSVTSVEDHGATEIDGEPVRWLSATVGEDAPDSEGFPRAGTELDVYLDADGHVRRIVYSRELQEGAVQRGTLDYLDLDAAETVEPPPPGSTISSRELYQPAP